MSPELTFVLGIVILALFGWYYATDSAARKRVIGLVLTLMLGVMSFIALWPPQDKVQLGLDLEGGSSFQIQLKPDGDTVITAELLQQAVEVIRTRLDALGLAEPLITTAGEDRILVQVAGLDPARIQSTRDQLQRVARLDFRLVDFESDMLVPLIQAGEAVLPPDKVILPMQVRDRDGKDAGTTPMLVSRKPEIDGSWVRNANAFYGQDGYGVALKMAGEGETNLWEISSNPENTGRRRMAIVLDEVIISAPVIQSALPNGEATITGNFESEEAQSLASSLMNPLKTPVEIIEERTVSATLGKESIRQGVVAGLIGIGITLVFMIFYYRFAGIIANVALLVNVLLLFGALCEFKFVLTLPGIAGIILTIGMAVDANVLIYERLREELALGKSLKAAIESAYAKAFSSIFDANVTTLITAAILFWQATGPVRGFSVTLMIGIIASMFTALLVTRNLFNWSTESGLLKSMKMVGLLTNTKIDFLGYRKIALVVSIALLGGSVIAATVRGEKNFGIDFVGGDLLVVQTDNNVTETQFRDSLAPIGQQGAIIQVEQNPGAGEIVTFRLPNGTGPQVQQTLQTAFASDGLEVLQTDGIGASFGKEMALKALWALGLGMIGILIYVTIRFEFSFAVGAIVAVIHDIVITLGVFSMLGRELSLIMVGAILTIAGYSINDTIVIFDRIREALRSGRKGSTASIMNEAINATLSRTLLTGGTTLLTLLALLILGGQTLNDFALAMIVGVIVGTYSSIFVAAPIVLWASRRKQGGLRREVKDAIQPETPAQA